MFAEGIFPIGDGLLDIDEERLKSMLVPDDINEIYEVEQTPFARGKFAAVRRAIHKNSGVHFAAKFLKRRRRAQSSDKEIKHEIAVLMLCNEANNIVKLNAVHESRSDTALLLELATGGELQTFLDNEECLNEAQARVCMREVLKALQFLHKRSIVHLDLKPQNILLAGERIEDGLKLCDFGISRFVTEGTNVREIVGTPDYVAPEVLQYEPLSLSTDIWSVGVLAYVLLSGFSPFGGETKQETFLNISQCALTFPDKLFGGVSSAAIDFIRKALRIKPNDRMTAAGCLEHIWLKDECNIDRHIFTNILSNKQQLEHNDDDEDVDDDDVDEDDDVDDENIDDNEDHVPCNGDDKLIAANDNGQTDIVNGVHNGIADNEKQPNNEVVVDNHNVDDVVDDDDVKVNNVKDIPEAISVDHSEEDEEDDFLTKSTTNTSTSLSSHNNTYNNRSSYVNPKTSNSTTNTMVSTNQNGHLNYLSNGYSNGLGKKSEEKFSKCLNGSLKVSHSQHNNTPNNSHNTTTKNTVVKTTTVVHNVPAATKAITIPLSSKQQPQQHQPHYMSTTPYATTTTPTTASTVTRTNSPPEQTQTYLHMPARRQSSESNKENTFLATKNINAPPLSIIGGIKKPLPTVTQSATATIVINPSVNHNATTTTTTYMGGNNIVATITLPTSCTIPSAASLNVTKSPPSQQPHQTPTVSSSSSSSNTHASALAPSMVTSANSSSTNSLFPDAPTTPKVIRKASNSDTSPTSVKALVKKFQLEGGEQPLSPPEFATNGSKPMPMPMCANMTMGQIMTTTMPLATSATSNGTSSSSSTKTNETKTKYINGRTSLQNPHATNNTTTTTATAITSVAINGGMRRASEPITAIHHSSKKAINAMQSSSAPAPISIPTSGNSLKTSCVYCKNLNGSNGCRHPMSMASSVQHHNSTMRNGTLASSASCSTNFSQSTKSLINGSSSNGSLTSSNSSSSTTSTSNASSNALLFGGGSSHLNSHLHHHTHGNHLNGHQHQHQHQHHHHHHHLHHHGVVVKTAAAAANGLSLDQGIIC